MAFATPITPDINDAERLSYAPSASIQARNYTVYPASRVTAEWHLVPLQNEVMALWDDTTKGTPSLKVKNATGSTIVKGSLVCINGFDTYPTISLSTNRDFNFPASYVVIADIADTATGVVSQYATIDGLDTSAYSAGDEVYLATAGTFTSESNINVNFKISPVGRIITVDPTTGSVFFCPGLRLDQSSQSYALQVVNNTGSTIPAGPVAITSWIESSLAFQITPAVGVRADAIIGADVANGDQSRAWIIKSFTSALDTTGSTLGDPVYVDDVGACTLTPTRQRIGSVKTIANPGVVKGYVYEPTPYRGSSTGTPASPLEGDMYYENSNSKVYIYANAGWIALI